MVIIKMRTQSDCVVVIVIVTVTEINNVVVISVIRIESNKNIKNRD